MSKEEFDQDLAKAELRLIYKDYLDIIAKNECYGNSMQLFQTVTELLQYARGLNLGITAAAECLSDVTGVTVNAGLLSRIYSNKGSADSPTVREALRYPKSARRHRLCIDIEPSEKKLFYRDADDFGLSPHDYLMFLQDTSPIGNNSIFANLRVMYNEAISERIYWRGHVGPNDPRRRESILKVQIIREFWNLLLEKVYPKGGEYHAAGVKVDELYGEGPGRGGEIEQPSDPT